MEIAILILVIVLILLVALCLFRLYHVTEAVRSGISASQKDLREEIANTTQQSVKSMGDGIYLLQKETAAAQTEKLEDLQSDLRDQMQMMQQNMSQRQEQSGKAVYDQLCMMEGRLKTFESGSEQKLENIRSTMSRQLAAIQEENRTKLDSIEATVSEKLDSQLQKSFHVVSERLEQVYKSLGEMQSISSGIGDLKKVLSNVKTRGMLGELQLGSILSEILAPEQYECEIPTIPNSSNHVEFAIRLPGQQDGTPVYLPIDSKFPGDTYAALQDAYESGDKTQIEAAKKALDAAIRKAAADIREKYVCPPYTTNFGVMFLPFEGLYAEVANSGMLERLQRDFHITIAGPSTMASMLNALQMGFRTLALQKRSNEVWEILTTVKNEFDTFGEVLEKAQKHIRQVDDDLDKLIGARTKKISKSLEMLEVVTEE